MERLRECYQMRSDNCSAEPLAVGPKVSVIVDLATLQLGFCVFFCAKRTKLQSHWSESYDA